MVKNDKWIKTMAIEQKMIEPFASDQVREGNISFGTSSYGYDFRLSDNFMIPKNNISINTVLDPKKTSDSVFESIIAQDSIVIQPNTTILGRSLEYFKIPRDIITIAFGKSTYARCGIFVNITPFEPQWEGYATLAISNISKLSVKVYIGEGIAQILFLQASEICEISYADRKGKYQSQDKITSAKI
jgi:dCTP deaminase